MHPKTKTTYGDFRPLSQVVDYVVGNDDSGAPCAIYVDFVHTADHATGCHNVNENNSASQSSHSLSLRKEKTTPISRLSMKSADAAQISVLLRGYLVYTEILVDSYHHKCRKSLLDTALPVNRSVNDDVQALKN